MSFRTGHISSVSTGIEGFFYGDSGGLPGFSGGGVFYSRNGGLLGISRGSDWNKHSSVQYSDVLEMVSAQGECNFLNSLSFLVILGHIKFVNDQQFSV